MTRRSLGLLLCLVLATALVPATALAQTPEPPDESRFQKVLLEQTDLDQPMRLKVADDGRVIYIERGGEVNVWDPDTQSSVTAGTVATRTAGETGLIGLALAPDFATTGHIYLNRALPGFSDEDSPEYRRQRVSRYTLSPDNSLDLDSEVVIIETINRGGGGHSGGDMLMTPDGELFITTGDNTGCCASAGYPPLDERPGREGHDAQRTSGNTNDVNGKLLRILPLPDGGYDIPDGNLFPESADTDDKTRPEIYAMGFRNLFTVGGYDPATGHVWVGDYGPDAALDDPVRGPRGYVRGILITEAANYGWPYCTADNIPYGDWDYVNEQSKGFFDCDNPVNDSPNNTGLTELPPITPAQIFYSYTAQEPWPRLFGGGFHAFDRYDYDADSTSPTKFPEWFDGRYLFGEFTTNFLGSARFGDEGDLVDAQRFLDGIEFGAPFDAEFGPDGSLYVIEFGSNSFSSTIIPPSISRIDYVEGNRVPLVQATSDVDSGAAPLEIAFDASGTTDPDGDDVSFSWDFDGDGTEDATGATATHTYTELGVFAPRLTVTDEHGGEAVANLSITVGNTRPVVEFLTPAHGGFAEFSEDIAYEVSVTDPEDDSDLDCTDVEVTYSLGHDAHAHPVETTSPDADCTGTVTPLRDGSHGNSAYVYHVLSADYTDSGGAGDTPALTGSDAIVLHPRAYQSQHNQGTDGITRARSVFNMGVDGSWLMFPAVDLAEIDRVNFEVSGEAGSTGGSWVLRAGSPDGPVVARADDLPDTGTEFWVFGAQFEWLTADIADPGGVHDLYVTVEYPEGVTPGRITLRDFAFITAPDSVTATLQPASPSGDNGWYTAPVTVSVSDEGDPAEQWDAEFSLDGQTWEDATEPVTLDADGAHEVRYRVVDIAGVTAGEGSLDVRIDQTAPTVAVSGVGDGDTLGDSGDLAFAVDADDATSGLDEVSATLDGEPVETGTSLPLWRLDLGDHELVVTATDAAGNTTTETIAFTTTTSLTDVRALLGTFHAEGMLSSQARNVLEARLRVAESRGDRLGDAWQARMLGLFADAVARHVDDTDARRVLLRDTDALIADLDGP